MRILDCLTYCPRPYNGHGPAQSCVSILENFLDSDASATLFVPRKTHSIGKPVNVVETLPLPFRWLPWSMVSDLGYSSLNRRFLKAIQAADPKQSIGYFWPDPPASLVTAARDRGLITVREMINSFRGNAKPILDKAYAAQGLAPTHGITDESIEREREELALYDYIFASNAEVEASLIKAGVKRERIIPTSFGWTPSRYASTASLPKSAFTALFVGSVSVRKGAPQLIEAWKRSGVAGELVFAGKAEPALAPLLARQADPSIRYLHFVSDMGALYRSADIFVFPTLEEGGPQVTYEAAGCGLPVITSPMGAGRITKDGVNGLIVEPDDIDGLAQAIARLAESKETRERFARQAAFDAQQFTYERLGLERSRIFRELLGPRS
jgi:glycosyltransferase involved in cell wall biosynthesis